MSEEAKTAAPRARKSWGRWAAFLGFLLLYSWAYTYLGSVLILEGNTSRTGNAQEQYIDAVYQAAAVREGVTAPGLSISSRFTQFLPQYTDGSVDPLWPWLMRWHADESPDELFERGKWMNMIPSGVLLIAMGLGAARAFSFTGSAAMVLMGGFGVILERSTYFSPDALYYLLVVLAWLCALSLIRQNLLWLYGVFGALLGLAYLAKALVWPIAAGFLIVSVIRSIADVIHSRKRPEVESLWISTNQLVGLAMMATAFLLVTGPRLSYANTEFGDPFHATQKYLVWLDSPSEAARFDGGASAAKALAEKPIDERPGLVRFLKEEGTGALLARAWTGALSQLDSSVFGRFWRGGWILLYGGLVFAVVAAIRRWAMWRQTDEVWRVRGASARWMLLFTAVVLGITLFYTGVGNRIIPSNSMTTSLFLPILLTFIWIAERYRRQLQRSQYARLTNRVYCTLMALPIAWISIRIVQALQLPEVG